MAGAGEIAHSTDGQCVSLSLFWRRLPARRVDLRQAYLLLCAYRTRTSLVSTGFGVNVLSLSIVPRVIWFLYDFVFSYLFCFVFFLLPLSLSDTDSDSGSRSFLMFSLRVDFWHSRTLAEWPTTRLVFEADSRRHWGSLFKRSSISMAT